MSAVDGARAIGAAVAAAAEAAQPTEAEQLDMLAVPRTLDDGRAERVREAVRRHRAAGRPPGARNLATRQALDFVRQVLGDPLIERARMAMHTPDSLALTLGCTKLEAAQFLDGIRADLMRLWYAPLAPVDSLGNAVVPQFNMQIGGAPAAGGAARVPWEYLETVHGEVIEKSAQSEPAAPVSHDAVSHEGDK